MMKKRIMLLAMLISISAFGCNKKSTTHKYNSTELSQSLPITYNDACYAVNVNEPKEVVGWGDYVFVAKVEEELRTEYNNVRVNEKEIKLVKRIHSIELKLLKILRGI